MIIIISNLYLYEIKDYQLHLIHQNTMIKKENSIEKTCKKTFCYFLLKELKMTWKSSFIVVQVLFLALLSILLTLSLTQSANKQIHEQLEQIIPSTTIMLKKKNNKGFTLVELLVVIAIIGILAVVAVPALFKNIEKGKVADLEGDISAIRSAALSYYADNSAYPTNGLEVSDALGDELEGLSKPFGGTYTLQKVYITLENKYSEDPSDKDDDKGEVLQLVIGVGSNDIKDMKTISASGVNKLKQDLGDKLTTLETTGQPQSADATEIVVNLIVNMY